VASPERHGFENILRGDATLTVRVYDRHAIAVRYVVGVYYTYLGSTRLRAIDWRNTAGSLR
jgi:hypothetical protein